MLFCCLWRNVKTSCRKHFVVISRHQQTRPLTTSDKCHNLPQAGGTILVTPGNYSVDSNQSIASYSPRMVILPKPPAINPPLGGSPLEYCHAVWYGKTRMAWQPNGEKFLKICLFVLTESTNETDRHHMTA